VPFEIARTKALLAQALPDGDAMLTEAIATAESLFEDAAAAAAAAPSAAPASVAGDTTLTEREREVLLLVGEGISNQAIAERLVLSPRTVERHVSNIYVKLGLEGRSSRAAAASYAVRANIANGGS
jgi:DNA-binding NarL/FixJ family response regulator